MKRTKKQAIAHARATISDLTPFGGQWRFSRYDPTVKAWRESIPTNFWHAAAQRRIALAYCAIEYYFDDPDRGEPWETVEGNWETYARERMVG